MALWPPKGKPQIQKKSHAGMYFGLAILLVAGAAAVYFVTSRHRQVEEVHSPSDRRHMIKEPDNVRVAMAPTATTNSPIDSVELPEPPKELWLGKEVKEHRVVTNNTLVVETFVTVDGKIHKYYHDERENVLPSAADQILALMTATDDGFGAPPLPAMVNFEDEFGSAIRTEIVVEESDSAEVKALKERVIAARKELLDLMARGVRANDVVKEYARMQKDNATIRFEAAKGVRELLDEGDVEGAKELCARYNEVLKRADIMQIEIPEEYLGKDEKLEDEKQ